MTPRASSAPVLYLKLRRRGLDPGFPSRAVLSPVPSHCDRAGGGDLSAADQATIVSAVQQTLPPSASSLTSTATAPTTATSHDRSRGTYADLGCAGGAGVAGIAPLDIGNANPSDIGFAFVQSGEDNTTLAQVIAHEAGHTYGLVHVSNNQDLMYPVDHRRRDRVWRRANYRRRRRAKRPGGAEQALTQTASICATATGTAAGTATAADGATTTAIPGLANLPASLPVCPGWRNSPARPTAASLIPGSILNISQLLPASIVAAGRRRRRCVAGPRPGADDHRPSERRR